MDDRDHSIECEFCGHHKGGLNDLECACEDVGPQSRAALRRLCIPRRHESQWLQ